MKCGNSGVPSKPFAILNFTAVYEFLCYFYCAFVNWKAVFDVCYCLQDLSKLNRDPGKILYVSGHAFENSLQPENCVPIKPFKIDETGDVPLDTALLDLIPFLECKLNFLSASTYYGPFDCPHGIETVIFLDFIAYKVLTFFLKYYSQNEGKNIITLAETE
jgi:hypothetical protein